MVGGKGSEDWANGQAPAARDFFRKKLPNHEGKLNKSESGLHFFFSEILSSSLPGLVFFSSRILAVGQVGFFPTTWDSSAHVVVLRKPTFGKLTCWWSRPQTAQFFMRSISRGKEGWRMSWWANLAAWHSFDPFVCVCIRNEKLTFHVCVDFIVCDKEEQRSGCSIMTVGGSRHNNLSHEKQTTSGYLVSLGHACSYMPHSDR